METLTMKRRDVLLRSCALVLASATLLLGWAKAAEAQDKVLYFTRCAGYEHSAVKPIDGGAELLGQSAEANGGRARY